MSIVGASSAGAIFLVSLVPFSLALEHCSTRNPSGSRPGGFTTNLGILLSSSRALPGDLSLGTRVCLLRDPILAGSTFIGCQGVIGRLVRSPEQGFRFSRRRQREQVEVKPPANIAGLTFQNLQPRCLLGRSESNTRCHGKSR